MFLQIIEGKTSDPAGLKERWQEWRSTVKNGAIGYEGSVAGVTSEGDFVAAVRFGSAEDAARNSARPEQTEWWNGTAALLVEPRFVDCPDGEMWIDRGHASATFVQVIQGPPGGEDHTDDEVEELEEIRADIIGGFSGTHPDGGFTTIVFFTDEESARQGESTPEFEEWDAEATASEDRRFWDLRDPWIDLA